MNLKILAAAAALTMLAAGAAKAQDYGTPPYGSSAYAFGGGGSCGGFTILGAYGGVTVLNIDVGVSGRARWNGGRCGGGAAAVPPPPPPAPAAYGGGGYYNQGGYAPVGYLQGGYPGGQGFAPPPPPPCACQGGYRPY